MAAARAVAPPTVAASRAVTVTVGGAISGRTRPAPHVGSYHLSGAGELMLYLVLGQPVLRGGAGPILKVARVAGVARIGRDAAIVVAAADAGAEDAVGRGGAVGRHGAAWGRAESERGLAVLGMEEKHGI